MTSTIGFANIDHKNETAILLQQRLETAAQAAGLTLICRDNDLSTEKARANVAEFAAYPVDLAIIAHIDERAGVDLVMPLKRGNIPVISVFIEIPLTIYYGPDDETAGQMVGDYLGQWVQANWNSQVDKLVVLTSSEILLSHQKRSGGALNALNDHVKLVPDNILYLDDGTDAELARKRVTSVLRNWSDYTHIIAIAMNDYIAGGVLRAIEDLGREDEVVVGSFEGTQLAIEEFRKPLSSLLVSPRFNSEQHGTDLINLALEILAEKHVSRRTLVPPTLFTRENFEAVE